MGFPIIPSGITPHNQFVVIYSVIVDELDIEKTMKQSDATIRIPMIGFRSTNIIGVKDVNSAGQGAGKFLPVPQYFRRWRPMSVSVKECDDIV